jgi:hypothetical protein
MKYHCNACGAYIEANSGHECYTPRPAPEHGSAQWKDDRAYEYCVDKRLLQETQVIQIPVCEGVKLGFMAIRYWPGSGTDCFRVDEIANMERIGGKKQ